jgi:hypothetical protein
MGDTDTSTRRREALLPSTHWLSGPCDYNSTSLHRRVVWRHVDNAPLRRVGVISTAVDAWYDRYGPFGACERAVDGGTFPLSLR